MNSTLWLDTLFFTFIKTVTIKLYFEDKEKLKIDETILNLSIHPIRFADDIFFNFETNNEKLRKNLRKYEVNYDIFYSYADVLKATYLKTVKKEKYKENSLLLIGQTEKDKVIFDGVRYLSLVDYIDDIRELSQTYKHIYFKPHPYAKNNKEIFKVLKKEFKNIAIVYDNIYHLLSSENIKCVVGLNSSVLYEAKYFRKEVVFLYKAYYEFETTDIGVYGDYFSSSFWADILDIEDTKVSLPFVPNRLRKALNDFWGYSEVSDEIVLKDILKSKVKYFISKYM